jgi:hypothetical protein
LTASDRVVTVPLLPVQALPFPAAAVRAFADSPAFLAVDHPAARTRVELSAETKATLSEDLLG